MKIKCGLMGAALLGVAALFTSSSSALASDPVGVYAFVDKVVLEPDDAKPERIQIWGGFALAEGHGDTYAKAKRGHMYFALKPGQEEICRKEWADLKSLAGTDQLVAFGKRPEQHGVVHPEKSKTEKPDVYVTGMGLTKVSKDRDYPPIKDLVSLKNAPADKAAKSASPK